MINDPKTYDKKNQAVESSEYRCKNTTRIVDLFFEQTSEKLNQTNLVYFLIVLQFNLFVYV